MYTIAILLISSEPPRPFAPEDYNKARAAPRTLRKTQPPISMALADDGRDDVAAGAAAVPERVLAAVAEEPVAELEEPDAELDEVDKTPEGSVPLALALAPVYAVAPTLVLLWHPPALADV